MTREPRVGIVMPVYNGSRFLSAAIESIQKQSFRDWELLIVDDGSTDSSAFVAASFAEQDPRIRMLHLTHVGIVQALNHGFDVVRGDLLARMDSDDVALSDRLLRQVQFLESQRDVAVVGCAIQKIDQNGHAIGIQRFPEFPDQVKRGLETGACIAHPTVVMRREVFFRVGGYREAFRHAEDYDLWLRISEVCGLANLGSVHLQYRVHSNQVSSRVLALQVMRTQAARVVRDLRSRGVPDPVGVDTEIDEEWLVDRGLARNLIHTEILSAFVSRIEMCGVESNEDRRHLIQLLYEWASSSGVERRTIVGRISWSDAYQDLRKGRLLLGLYNFVVASVIDPRLVVSRLWLFYLRFNCRGDRLP